MLLVDRTNRTLEELPAFSHLKVDGRSSTAPPPQFAHLCHLSLPSVTNCHGSFANAFPPLSFTSYNKNRSCGAEVMSGIHLRFLKIPPRWRFLLLFSYIINNNNNWVQHMFTAMQGMTRLGDWTSAHFTLASCQRRLSMIHTDRYGSQCLIAGWASGLRIYRALPR